MIRSNGGWYDYNWNPVCGCRHDCNYCYLPKYMERFTGQKTLEPKFYPAALEEPYQAMKGAKIFVCAFADLFGSWIPESWILQVLNVIKNAPDKTFYFLTKNPQRYKEFQFTDNCYIGVTVEDRDRMFRADLIRDLPYKKLLSIEPILGNFDGVDLSMFDLVVAGYMLNQKTTRQDRTNMRSVIHKNKYQIIR